MGCILPNLWVGKKNMCSISIWRSGCHFLRNDDRFTSVSCFSLSLSFSVAALPDTRRGSTPPHLWKIAENKQNIVTGHLEHERRLKSNNKLNGTRHLDEWGTGATVRHQWTNPLVGWGWSWQMSKSWPKMIALITTTYTDVWRDETKRLIKSSKMFSLHVKKVSCKEQMWIF